MANYNDVLFQQRVANEMKARLEAYRQGWQYYRGEQALPLRVKPGQSDDNIVINLYEYIIDKGVSFLFGKAIEFQLKEGASEEASTFLGQCWESNRKMSFLGGVALNGGVCGHPFVKIIPREGDVPRLVNLDPAIVAPIWSPDDLSDVLRYVIEYEGMDIDGKQIFKKQVIEAQKDASDVTTGWLINNFVRPANQRDYVPDSKKPTEPWEYIFAPIVDWQNLPAPNEYFGKADIESVRMQNGINFVASNIQRIIRLHGHPKTVGKGFTAKQVNIGPDEMIILPSADSDVFNLEMQSDLSASRNYFNDLKSLFLRTKRVPDLDPAVVNVGALSGFALRILYGDMLGITEMKRRSYGDGLKDLCGRLLAIGGHQTTVNKIVWQDPLPENVAETANALDVIANKLNVISKETMAEKLSLDWEVEKERMQEQGANQLNLGSVLLQAFSKGQGLPAAPSMPVPGMPPTGGQ